MENSTFFEQSEHKTQQRSVVSLQKVTHNDQLCCEYIVESEKFSYKKWLIWMAVFNIFGFILNLHTQDSSVMTIVLIVLVIMFLLKLNFKVKKESLLVISSVGIQLTTTFSNGRTTSTFYDMTKIKDIVINEALTMQQVLVYLTILLRKDRDSSIIDDLVPLFTNSWPSLDCLKKIYVGSQKVLQRKTTQNGTSKPPSSQS